jgi:hypothetical protein
MQSSKGLEFRSVIFIGLLPRKLLLALKLLNQLARLFIPANLRGV